MIKGQNDWLGGIESQRNSIITSRKRLSGGQTGMVGLKIGEDGTCAHWVRTTISVFCNLFFGKFGGMGDFY